MVRATLVLVFLLLLWSPTAHAEKRVALVIGNGAYANAAQLPNPPRDAEAIASFIAVGRLRRVCGAARSQWSGDAPSAAGLFRAGSGSRYCRSFLCRAWNRG